MELDFWNLTSSGFNDIINFFFVMTVWLSWHLVFSIIMQAETDIGNFYSGYGSVILPWLWSWLCSLTFLQNSAKME